MNRSIPYIDPDVKHVGVSKLRSFTAEKLKDMTDAFVIQENNNPLAVLVSYEKYLVFQDQMKSMLATFEMLVNEVDRDGIKAGLEDVKNLRTRALSEIRAEIRRRG